MSPQFIYFISIFTCGEFQICGEFEISYSIIYYKTSKMKCIFSVKEFPNKWDILNISKHNLGSIYMK